MYVALEYQLVRNAYVLRAKQTIESYLETEKYGIADYTKEQRLKALFSSTESGLDRTLESFHVVKPLFMQ